MRKVSSEENNKVKTEYSSPIGFTMAPTCKRDFKVLLVVYKSRNGLAPGGVNKDVNPTADGLLRSMSQDFL